MKKPVIGVIGLAVMGSNLSRNIASRGYRCAVYNRNGAVTRAFVESYGGESFEGHESISHLVASLPPPRRIFLMIKAGSPVDQVLDELIPLLTPGDVLLDGGNSYFEDTVRREQRCHERGIFFLGVGISGGEEGALRGPSIMPGGPVDGWYQVAQLLSEIAAVSGGPCTCYIGPGGAGHFVKMVHNGIEYGDMQLIAEAYHLLKDVGGCRPDELSDLFGRWNSGVLESYLIEITSAVFRRRDDLAGGFLLDKILDRAEQKGTGRWTAETALELGVSIPTISAAVDARVLSSMKEQRKRAATLFSHRTSSLSEVPKQSFLSDVHDALYCAKILAYAQGMALLCAASEKWNWNLKLGEIAAIWRGGCIIRAKFLNEICRAYTAEQDLENLLFDRDLQQTVARAIESLRRVVATAASNGIPVLGHGASLAYFESLRREILPQNLTQAQRDFFGAHTYERTDRPGIFHTEWG